MPSIMTSGLWNYLLALRDKLLNRPLPYQSTGSGSGSSSGKAPTTFASAAASTSGTGSGSGGKVSCGVVGEAADDEEEEEEEEEEPWIDECSSEPHTTGTPALTSPPTHTPHAYTSTIHNTDAATGAVIPPTQTTEHW